ncbi:MAG: hypothetical protein HZC41_10875 [Chloroflexi bacterium]|nr:hypothetical protein [Chloroflexota bacterium]
MKQVRGLFMFMLILAALVYSPVYAHEGREVGEYTLEIGWREEPAYTGLMNGPEITVNRHGGEDEHDEGEATPEAEGEHTNTGEEDHAEESTGVTGLEDTLQIEVTFGPASKTLSLRPVRNEPGHYTADLIPMRPGDYTFRVFGTIEGIEIDETFSASDGQFSTVEPIEDIQFP